MQVCMYVQYSLCVSVPIVLPRFDNVRNRASGAVYIYISMFSVTNKRAGVPYAWVFESDISDNIRTWPSKKEVHITYILI